MKPKIILHCGAPKTGSTSFQHLLYANIDLLAKAGFYCPSVSRKRREKDDLRILLGAVLREENDNPAFVERIRTVLSQVASDSGAHTLVISNESLLGKPASRKYPEFYERADGIARRVRHVLEGYDVEVRFVLRDYAGFLPSWYVQQVRMGSKQDFNGFLRAFDFDAVTWKTPVEALRRHFGPENVGIYDHADLVRDSHAFLTAMFPDVMAALGEKGRKLPSKNISIGRGMVETYRRWNVLSERLAPNGASRRTLHQIGRRYVLLPLERFSRSEKLVLPADLAASLSARYRADVQEIGPRRVVSAESEAVRHAAQ